ncbi:hypothetical protein BGW41_005206 [Actinomortierella wolfii]|nr:hypothetical protein BGW41_005206 [Actinomortierella wolfii]
MPAPATSKSSSSRQKITTRTSQYDFTAAAFKRGVYPDSGPIAFQYTLYYPGNMDLIITAGHGGHNTPGEELSPAMTHVFQPCLPKDEERQRSASDSGGTVVTIECFAVPIASNEDNFHAPSSPPGESSVSPSEQSGKTHQQNYQGQQQQPHEHHYHHGQQQPPRSMPKMPLRDPSRGGNFKGDLNTTRIAMELAHSISDIVGDENTATSRALYQGAGMWSTDSLSPQQYVFSTSSKLRETPWRKTQTRERPRPHVVLFRVPRRFVDVNRDASKRIENAVAEDSPESKAAWEEYHGVIDHVRALVGHQHPQQKTLGGSRGLLLDIHGHTHATEMIEIGYLVDGATLAQRDAVLDAQARELARTMSIRSLVEQSWNEHPSDSHRQQRYFNTIDANPFGGMLQRQGLSAVPSPQNRAPCDECLFFYGGYTIQRHGSANGGSIDAIQLELPRSLRLVTQEEMQKIYTRMGRAIVEFLQQYYGLKVDHSAAAEEVAEMNLSSHERTGSARSNPITECAPAPVLAPAIKSAVEYPIGPLPLPNRKAVVVRYAKPKQPQQQQYRLSRTHSGQSLKAGHEQRANESGDESEYDRPPPDLDLSMQPDQSPRPILSRKSSRL